MRLPLLVLALATLTVSGQVPLSILPVGDDETPEAFELHWEAEAGFRYEPRYSSDLLTWTTIEGFPATATASGAAEPIMFESIDDPLFFRIWRWDVADAIAPSSASDFTAASSGSSATLTWTDAADSDVAWYELTWSPGGAAASIIPAGTETFLVTGLTPATNYSFTIKTVDSSGNRSPGVTAHASTEALLPLTISVTPTRVAMSQFESLVLTATVDPMPDAPLRFEWRTLGMYGTLNSDDSAPSEYVDDDVSDGTSEVTYTATLPGGVEDISVEVFFASEPDLSSNDLVVGQARLEVSGPEQTAVTVVYEHTTLGDRPETMSTEFIVAEIIEAIPGVVTYIFRLESPPGEGWNSGPLGYPWSYRVGTSLRDSDFLIEEIGSDVFGLGDSHLAVISRGGGVFNYDPSDPKTDEKLEGQRAHYNQRYLAKWSVTPNTLWDRWDE